MKGSWLMCGTAAGAVGGSGAGWRLGPDQPWEGRWFIYGKPGARVSPGDGDVLGSRDQAKMKRTFWCVGWKWEDRRSWGADRVWEVEFPKMRGLGEGRGQIWGRRP